MQRIRRVRREKISLCECGCGKPTKLADRTWARYEMVKGKPLRFIKGHNRGVGHLPTRERILAYVRKVPSGCWLWTGAVRTLYGAIGVNGKLLRAHRASYMEFIGPIPSGMYVLHECDTPLCVNPRHLFLGTGKDNSEDKVSKGRQARGESNGAAVLTEKKVLAIREYEGTHTLQSTADHFGVSKGAVACIVARRTWKHI